MQPLPGLLAELTGSDVKEYTFTSPAEDPVYADWNGREMEMPVFNDIMEPAGGEVLAVYKNSYYAGKAAFVEHHVGSGKVLHLGSAFSRGNVKMLLEYTNVLEPFAELINAGDDVEIIMRRKDGRSFLFVLNFCAGGAVVELKHKMPLLYTGEWQEGRQVIPAFGTAVYEVV